MTHYILFLGDPHLGLASKGNAPPNIIKANGGGKTVEFNFVTAEKKAKREWLINDLKFQYEEFKKGNKPDIVFLCGGNLDLPKVSSSQVVVTRLLKFIKYMKKEGVKSVIICGLLHRPVPPPYNDQVDEINKTIFNRIRLLDGVFYTTLHTKRPLTSTDFAKKDSTLMYLSRELYATFWSHFEPVLNAAYIHCMVIEAKQYQVTLLIVYLFFI